MRPRIGLAWVAVLALLLAACQGSATAPEDTATTQAQTTPTPQGTGTDAVTDDAGSDSDALERITDAVANTTEAGTARFELSVVTEGTGGGDGEQPVTVEGEEDFAAQQRAMAFVGPSGELRVVVDGTEVYVEIPATEDEDWARVDLDALMADDAGFGGPGGLPFSSPQANLAVLSGAVTSASEGGEEDVRGEPATRYDLTVDLEAAAEQAADDTREGLVAAARESGVTELDMQVWIDAEERVNRIAYSLDLSQADTDTLATELASEGVEADVEGEPQGQVTVDVEYFDFGTDVTIEIPDDGDVVDIDEDQVRDSLTSGGG